MARECDFCEKPAIATGLRFAGNHGGATGPFSLCKKDLAFQAECNGFPFGRDLRIIDQEAYDEAEGLT